MKVDTGTVIYFSPTGSTKKYARTVSEAMNLKSVNEINFTAPDSRETLYEKIDSDIVIIGFPVYEEYAPDIFIESLNKLDFSGQPVLAFAVYGKIGFGLSLKQMYLNMVEKGLKVISLGALIAEHSFSTERIPLAQGRPNKQDLEDAVKLGEMFLSRAASETPSVPFEQVPGKLPLMAKILPENSAGHFTKEPRINSQLCNNCRLCIEKCPVNAINDDLSMDSGKCIRCFACVKNCKTGARKIEYKKIFLIKMMFNRHNRIEKHNILI